MHKRLLILFLVAGGWLAGCDDDRPVVSAVPPASPLHGGILVPLTNNQGFAELLNDKREKKGSEYQTTIVAYLLQPDQKTAFAEKASSVSVKLDLTGGEKAIPLQPASSASDAIGGTRYVSDFGPFELNNIQGEITVKAGGKTLTGTFRGPR